MIFHYLDASAWVKRYYQESGTDWIQNLFAQNETLVCASLGLVEVMATLSRKRKAREIASGQFIQKAKELEEDWERFIQIQMTTETMNSAKQLARDLALRGADAIHLASALTLKKRFVENNDRLVVVASDHELEQAAQSRGLEVIDPTENVY